MAARENQGYLIAVIILVLMVLVLGLTTFLGFQSAGAQTDLREAADKQRELYESLTKAHETEAGIYRAFIGEVGGFSVAEVGTQLDRINSQINTTPDDTIRTQLNTIVDNIKEVKAIYDADMKQNVASEGEDAAQEFTWRGLVKNLAAVVAKKHSELAVNRNDNVRIRREANAELAAKEKTVQTIQTELGTVKKQLKDVTDQAVKDKQTLNAALTKITDKNDQDVRQFETVRNALQGQIATLEGEKKTLTAEKDRIKRKYDKTQVVNYDLPDGKIVRVSPKLNKVYLNIGTIDGLRTNRTFAVYDKNTTNFQKDKHKAMIEVTDVTGARQSEARVTLEDPLQPILQGDYILTATWDPGYRVPIALIGIFDLDDDGNSDRLRLVQMIEKNGGDVVAQHDEDGKVIGKIDAATRFVVLGNSPSGTDFNPNVQLAIQELRTQAKDNSVQQISVRKLLNWMGTHGRAKTQRLDVRMGEEFQRRDAVDALRPDNEDDR